MRSYTTDNAQDSDTGQDPSRPKVGPFGLDYWKGSGKDDAREGVRARQRSSHGVR